MLILMLDKTPPKILFSKMSENTPIHTPADKHAHKKVKLAALVHRVHDPTLPLTHSVNVFMYDRDIYLFR